MLSRELSHPYSLAYALFSEMTLHKTYGEIQATQERVETFLEMDERRSILAETKPADDDDEASAWHLRQRALLMLAG